MAEFSKGTENNRQHFIRMENHRAGSRKENRSSQGYGECAQEDPK